MATLTEAQIQTNLRAVEHAIAQQELEGLDVPEEVKAELLRAARGEIGIDEVERNTLARLRNVPILGR